MGPPVQLTRGILLRGELDCKRCLRRALPQQRAHDARSNAQVVRSRLKAADGDLGEAPKVEPLVLFNQRKLGLVFVKVVPYGYRRAQRNSEHGQPADCSRAATACPRQRKANLEAPPVDLQRDIHNAHSATCTEVVH